MLASDGRQAIDLYRDHPPIDLVLLDADTPRMTGTEAMTRLRAINASARCCLMVNPGRGGDADRLWTRDVEVLFHKPFHPADVAACLCRLLSTGASPLRPHDERILTPREGR